MASSALLTRFEMEDKVPSKHPFGFEPIVSSKFVGVRLRELVWSNVYTSFRCYVNVRESLEQ